MKPILFNTEMVWAILEGRKTQTRRVIKPQPIFESGYDYPHEDELGIFWKTEKSYSDIKKFIDDCLYGQPGDILWVRETWAKVDRSFGGDLGDGKYAYVYRASKNGHLWESEIIGWKWKPSIHMPKEAARIFLRVTDVRIEQVQDITEEDALAEGISGLDGACYSNNGWNPTPYDPDSGGSPIFKDGYRDLWDSIYAKQGYGWDTNPWVEVDEFEVEEIRQ